MEEHPITDFIQQHRERLERYSTNLVGDMDAAKDIVQQTMIEIYKNWDHYDPTRASLGTWVMRKLRFRAIDHLRKTAKSVHVPARIEYMDPNTPDPRVNHESENERLDVQSALTTLPYTLRQVATQYFMDNQTCADIGTEMSVDPTTVYRWLVRARTILIDALMEYKNGKWTHTPSPKA